MARSAIFFSGGIAGRALISDTMLRKAGQIKGDSMRLTAPKPEPKAPTAQVIVFPVIARPIPRREVRTRADLGVTAQDLRRQLTAFVSAASKIGEHEYGVRLLEQECRLAVDRLVAMFHVKQRTDNDR